jgi:NADPH-dependent ferric siderophore reductase
MPSAPAPATATAPAPATLGDRVIGLFTTTGTVTRIEPIAANMRLIRVESDEIARLAWTPAQHVRVHVGARSDRHGWLRPRDALRTYSVWNHDGDGLELCVLDLCSLDHGTGGPGARWARALRTGHPVTFGRPEGSFTLRDAPYHVFAGEETAAVAFGAMLRALPAGAPAYGVIEVDGPGDRLPLAHDLHWEYRDGRPAAASETLVEAVHRLELPPGPGVAYLAGEARTIAMLRRHLIAERGWPRQAIRTKPFWAPGRCGLD